MQYRTLFFSLILCFLASSSQAQQKRIITIAADAWCPINCIAPETRLGVGIDLAKAIFEPLGYEINYQVMPWSEALSKVRTGKVDAVIGASRYDDRSLILPQESIYTVTDDFYVLKGSSWRFQGIHTLKGKKLGVIDSYGYGDMISEYIRNNQELSDVIQFARGEKALEENIKKLLSYKIDVLVETRPVMEYNIARMHLADKISWAGSSPQAPVYLAFSPALPSSQSLATEFDRGINRLKAAGRLDRFYSAYGLSSSDR